MTLKGLKDKLLETNPNLERTMTLCQGTEKLLIQCSELYHKITAVSMPLTKVFKKKCNTRSMFLMF